MTTTPPLLAVPSGIASGGDPFQGSEAGVTIQPRWGNRWSSNTDTLRNIICVGDSTVQGTGLVDPWPSRLRRQLALTAAPSAFQGWGYRPLWLTTEWAFGANWAAIPSTDISDQSPFGPGGVGGIANVGGVQDLTGGTGAADQITWTRPTNMPVSLIRVYFTDPSALSAGWAYSTDGGTTWHAVAVDNRASAPCRTFDITAANPATLKIAAATVSGTTLNGASVVRGILGISTYSATQVPSRTVQDATTAIAGTVTSEEAYFTAADVGATFNHPNLTPGTTISTFTSRLQVSVTPVPTANGTAPGTILGANTGAIVHNMGKAADFFFELDRATTGANKWAVLDSIGPDLVVVGPFSNDMTIGNTGTYAQNLADLATHFAGVADILVLGCFEQSGRDVPTQNAFRSALQAQAALSGCAFLDLHAAWGSFATASAAGLMGDSLHESQLGGNDVFGRVYRLLKVFA